MDASVSFPDECECALVAAIGAEIDTEGFDRLGQRLQAHFRAPEIESRVVVQVELAGFLIDDERPFFFVRNGPDAVVAFGRSRSPIRRGAWVEILVAMFAPVHQTTPNGTRPPITFRPCMEGA